MVDYEPPQGVVIPEIDEDLEVSIYFIYFGLNMDDFTQLALYILQDASIYFDSDGKGKNRWLLSEDPDDRYTFTRGISEKK